jgi:maltooligosyltrehalose trehalohydrolase
LSAHSTSPAVGALYLGAGRCAFSVWAPQAQRISVHLLSPRERMVALKAAPHGYFAAVLEGVEPGARYFYRLESDGAEPRERPDPASRCQPEGVHGPSQVTDQNFDWHDAGWRGLPLPAYILYELHVGAFTSEGTFDAIIPRLPELKALGVTTIEIMPVAQFPGDRNWVYDGVYPYAVQNSYGGPEGLKRLVDACHQQGLAVTLDVVYNHLGAEGNYLWDYAPYFTDRYKTAWGSAVNFDGPASDEVRAYFIGNALYWLREFHIDALRLDAIHAMLDFSAGTFLEQLAATVENERWNLGRQSFLIGESDLNDPRIVRTIERYGLGLDAQWSDDLHHALHVLLTGEKDGYYRDFAAGAANGPALTCLVKALREGYVYTGQYAAHRGRRHGAPPKDIPGYRFVVCAQNHDQVGNRRLGDRLSQSLSPARLKLAAAVVLLSPFIPLLFMGEEYGETAPFQYFVSHQDPALIEAVRQGRKRDFAAFGGQAEPPDPAAAETFRRSQLNPALKEEGWHRDLYEFYRALIMLRQTQPALAELDKDHLEALGLESSGLLYLRRWQAEDATARAAQTFAVLNFSQDTAETDLPVPTGRWRKTLASRGDGLPAEITSVGQVRLSVPGEAVAVYMLEHASESL